MDDVTLPAVGSLAGLAGHTGFAHLFYLFTSPLYPATVFAFDRTTGQSRPFEAARPAVDVGAYEGAFQGPVVEVPTLGAPLLLLLAGLLAALAVRRLASTPAG